MRMPFNNPKCKARKGGGAMKKSIFILALLVLAVGLSLYPIEVKAQMGRGMMGGGMMGSQGGYGQWTAPTVGPT
jgi:hypothetical protein